MTWIRYCAIVAAHWRCGVSASFQHSTSQRTPTGELFLYILNVFRSLPSLTNLWPAAQTVFGLLCPVDLRPSGHLGPTSLLGRAPSSCRLDLHPAAKHRRLRWQQRWRRSHSSVPPFAHNLKDRTWAERSLWLTHACLPQTAHMVMSYCAVLSLAILKDDLERLNTPGLVAFIKSCQTSRGR